MNIPKDLESYGVALKTINDLNDDNILSTENLISSMIGLKQEHINSIAVKNKDILLSNAKTQEDLAQLLRNKGLTESQATLTAQEVINAQAKATNIAVTKLLNQSKIEEALVTAGLTTEEAKNTAAKIANIQATAVETGATKAVTQAKIQETLSTTTLSASQAKNIATTIAGTGANMGLLASIKAVTAGLWAQTVAWLATPVGIITVATAAIYGLYKAVDYANKAYDRQVEKLKETSDKYKQITSDLEEAENKLIDIVAKIDEINSKDTPTLTDINDLEQLKQENQELQNRIDLLKLEKEIESAEKNQTAIKTAQVFLNTKVTPGSYSGMQIESEYTAALKAYERLIDRQNELNAKVKLTPDEIRELESLPNKILLSKKPLADLAVEASNIADEITNTDKRSIELKDTLVSLRNEILSLGKTPIEIKLDGLNDLLDNKFPEIGEEIKKLASTGTLIPEIIKSYKDFNQELIALGWTAEEVVNELNNINEAASSIQDITLDVTLEGLKTAESDINSLSNALKEFTDNGNVSASALVDLQEKFGDVSGFNNFIKVVSNAKSTTADIKSALNELASQYLETSDALQNLTDENKDLVIAQLEAMGVTNASEVVISRLTNAKIEAKLKTFDFTKATEEEISVLYNELKALGLTEQAISSLISTYTSAQQAMLNALQSGAATRLGILNSELQGIKSLADAYDVLAGQTAYVGTEKNRSGYKEHAKEILAIGTAQDELAKLMQNVSANISVPSGSKKSSSGSKVELYIADINKLYAAEERLKQIQDQRGDREYKRDISQTSNERLNYMGQLIDLYKQEQKALHNINELRRKQINDNVAKLQKAGFKVNYDSVANNLMITNQEHINKLFGSTTEKTNELRKSYEGLISETIQLNDANVDAGAEWRNLQKSIGDTQDEIYNQWLQNHKDNISLLELKDEDGREIVKNWKLVLQGIQNEIDYWSKQGLDASSEKIRSLTSDLHDAKYEMANALDNIVKKATEGLDDINGLYSDLLNTAKEFAENGFITADSYKAIISHGVEYLSLLEDEDGQLNINHDSIQKIISARTEQLA